MSNPESLVKAFAAGMIEALLAAGEKPKKEKPVVAKVDDIKEAVREYLDKLAQQEEGATQEPLFPQAEVDMGEAIYNRVQEARARADAREEADVYPEGTYNPDNPDQGREWQSPIR